MDSRQRNRRTDRKKGRSSSQAASGARSGGIRKKKRTEANASENMIYGRNTVLSYLTQLDESTPTADQRQESKPGSVNKLFFSDSGERNDPRLKKVRDMASRLDIPVSYADTKKLDELTGAGKHQGIAAQLAPIELLSGNDLLEMVDADMAVRASRGRSMDGYTVVLADGIEDPRNLGAIIRTAEATGARAVVIPERRAVGVTHTVAKTSAGALAHLPVVRVTNLVRIIEQLKEKGLWAVGLSLDGSQSIYDVELRRAVLLIVGSEGKGIGRLVSEKCDFLVRIPLAGKTQSLNASVAAGIGLSEIVRQNSETERQ